MAEPSTANNTNDIARHTPFVALRRPSHHSFVAYAVMHDPAPRLPRISLPLTRVDKGKRRAWMSSPCSEILSFALNVLPSSRRTPPRVVPRIRRSPLARCDVVLGIVRCLRAPCGLHLFALDLLGEKVVEHRADDHDSRQDLYLGDRRRHRRA